VSKALFFFNLKRPHTEIIIIKISAQQTENVGSKSELKKEKRKGSKKLKLTQD